ncbi:MAG: cobyric acid synthase [Desulfobacterales bacterium]|nr:cobyric acid synthase [Desulfobacterales bacterium]
MLQGTCSDAGKSVLTAAFCRILLQDGLRVAPFKAQNMSLNSFVTRHGLEMGRAQVVQAQAARLDPDVRMNPVLLKPSSDVGSQVIVMGKPVANMKVAEYLAYKPTAWQAITDAYDSLAREYDLIVLEGAGSPGEINLKHHDIVNMAMARHAGARVLLVGDIDRGGVFASLVGHYELMEEWERQLMAGYLINRFRGDASLLEPAFSFMRERTGWPTFGVVPYLVDLGLPQEDSVSFKNGLYDKPVPAGEHVQVAMIDLPHISNFTDIEPFLNEPDVDLRIVRRSDELGSPAALILPGSKNVIADLEFLVSSGLAGAVCRLAEGENTEIIGICGGFQMLGRTISDPHGLESDGRSLPGLGLLDLETVLDPDKTLVQRSFVHCDSGEQLTGYEIHHGRSVSSCRAFLEDGSGQRQGAVSADGLVWGSYLHGIFDQDRFRRWFIDRLRVRNGYAAMEKILAPYDLEPALDRLAAAVRASLDMAAVYRLLGR